MPERTETPVLALLFVCAASACGEGATQSLPPAGHGRDGAVGDSRTTPEHTDAGPVADSAPSDARSSDAEVVDSGDDFPPECQSCREDGQSCVFSLNCRPGSICNAPGDPLFDPAAPPGVCVRVLCQDNSDCMPPRQCNLSGRCDAPVCQDNSDCGPNLFCVSGACRDRGRPEEAQRCVVTSKGRVLAEGERYPLKAVVLDAAGRTVPGVEIAWSSDSVRRAFVENGDTLVGGRESGIVLVTASFANGRVCDEGVSIIRPSAAAPGQLRVVVTNSGTGGAVAGARVTAFFENGRGIATTNNLGMVGIDQTGMLRSVTAERDGFRTVSVLVPNNNDVVVQMTPDPVRITGALRMPTGAEVPYGVASTAWSQKKPSRRCSNHPTSDSIRRARFPRRT